MTIIYKNTTYVSCYEYYKNDIHDEKNDTRVIKNDLYVAKKFLKH